jgi:hypothetical protein
VRSSVEETLNALQRGNGQILRCTTVRPSADRPETGTDERKLETKAVEVKLRVPKLRLVHGSRLASIEPSRSAIA